MYSLRVSEIFITIRRFCLPILCDGERALRLTKENQAFQTVIQLRTEEPDEMLGEAVVSESESEIRLHGIFVKREFRGRGYGATLMEAVLSLGEDKLLTLCTGLGNVAFFERFGFEITEIGESLIYMEKQHS